MPYRAPVRDIRFILDHVVGFAQVSATPRFAEATPDMAEAILTEAGRIATGILAPLNRAGDQHPARLENGAVVSSPGFAEGYRAIATGGWVGMAASPDHGGMGLPISLALGVDDMMSGACLALQLKPLLSKGQIEALEHHASDDMKALYLPKLTSGEWSGTMNLTEPQAGSDVGALRSKAEPLGDGTYAVTGQKIYITWGDSDLVSNVCHLVLARLPDGAEGTKGISLFMVPKFIPDAAGQPGQRNSLRVVSLEHKLGIHGSPTCVMQFEGAKGWLVGAPHKGMAAMFTMMNNARLSVAAQGVGVAEAALQHALAYAGDRHQGATPLSPDGAIIDHADVRRMLALMRAEVFAARSIALSCAVAIDMATATGSADWQARAALLTPIAKAHGTDIGCEVAHLGVQIHGGMGFVEETGAAQFSRDARITPIYEGTNGIQAMDLVARKMADGGEAAFRLIDEVQRDAEAARPALPDLAGDVWQAAKALREATEGLLAQPLNDRFAGAVPYLRGFARILGGHAHLKAAVADPTREPLARVMIRRIMPEHLALFAQGREGAAGLYALTHEDFAA
ncbi:acyl-CoA dehydrogenase [Tabrizicola piscis]|uniref:3-methylmercaptopropionyl-CoA dehydrogenase n=1 Tax=Tabrizicola piscis TaxID=2494374 RepID=A0A3S8U6D4_9RHOB|nr:acyl-CoA dehydrogenase [Tabrizicola piscis]AZL59115.1 acyl-CoA dehydrogenase [Tabrizicola piscis]